MIRAPSWLRLIPGRRTRQLGTRFDHSGFFLLLETKLLLMPSLNSQRKQFWMGLTDGRKEGSWVVESTLKAVEYTNWAHGEPNNQGHMWAAQNCAFLNKNNRWDDWECRKNGGWGHSINALCERHRFPPIKNHFDCKTNQNPYPTTTYPYPNIVYTETKKTTRKPWNNP